jgi:hypothetical protein
MAKEKDKRTNNDLQNITHKITDRVTRTPLKTGDELRCSGRVSQFIYISFRIILIIYISYLIPIN